MRTSDDNRRELYPTCHGVIRPLFNLRVVSLFFLLTVGWNNTSSTKANIIYLLWVKISDRIIFLSCLVLGEVKFKA
ncbi:hypothetical protein ASPFODRAFT_287198 [Aspergillus luchuensis CBS 106.47]|uniref:Uncharacterized protein n=1 Tax=Aspergillus luchuensis (strain CBS 106.47) TaxID=1137211 RepID=A0A1M3TAG9_ASPLC|nr:hypothetical protein ASPFODRAFT_287198 [Aspergillus luchuensis CBS 106.47]